MIDYMIAPKIILAAKNTLQLYQEEFLIQFLLSGAICEVTTPSKAFFVLMHMRDIF